MRPRRNVRLAALARGHVPLCFSVLSGQRPASSYLGLAGRAKLSGVVRVHVLIEFQAGPYLHDQARGCSRYFPRPLFPYSMQSISMLYMPKPHKRLACAVCAASSFESLDTASRCCLECSKAFRRSGARHAVTQRNCLICYQGPTLAAFCLDIGHTLSRLECMNGNTYCSNVHALQCVAFAVQAHDQASPIDRGLFD